MADDIRGLPPLATHAAGSNFSPQSERAILKPLVQIFADRILPRRPDALFHIYGIHDLKPGMIHGRCGAARFLPAGLSETARAAIRIHRRRRAPKLLARRAPRVMLYLGHKVEAFFSLAEAQAMGVPCVVAPVAVLPERVIEGNRLYAGRSAGFADAALALLSDDRCGVASTESGVEVAARNFLGRARRTL